MALHAHTEDVDEQRVKAYVQNRAADDADHRVEGVALEAELVIDRKGGGHEGRRDKNPTQVLHCRRNEALVLSGRTEEFCDRL